MARSTIQLYAVDNNGPNTLLQFLRDAGKGAHQIDIAAAFVTASGLRSVLYLLQRAAKKGSVRVLTGLYQRFTEPMALRSLLKLGSDSKGMVEVKVSRDEHFHWKAYYVRNGAVSRAAVGSSNMTDMGLSGSGELNLVVTTNSESGALNRFVASFDAAWDHAVDLNASLISRYERHRKKFGPPQPPPHLPLREILGANDNHRQVTKHQRRFWRTCVDGRMSKKTEDLLDQVVSWDRYWALNGLPKAAVGIKQSFSISRREG